MIIKAKSTYKWAIVVDEDFITETETVLKQYFDEVTYEANLINGDRISFISAQELIEYDNFGKKALKSLDIYFGRCNIMRIESNISLLFRYGSTIRVTFEIDDNDHCETLKRKIQDICNKHKQPMTYRLASRFSTIQLIIIMAIISAGLNIYGLCSGKIMEVYSNTANFPPLLVFNITVMGVALGFIIVKLLDYCLGFIFPEIVFYFGENQKKSDANATLKSNIFWCVIVAFFVSFVCSMFFING